MVTFNIDPARTALLVVDLQRVFVDGSPVAAPDGPAVLRRLNQLAVYCRQRGIHVIHTRHVVRPDHSNAGLPAEVVPAVPQGVIDDGSVSAELHPELDIVPGDITVAKPRFGAFHGTDLETILRAAGIDTLIIGGIATNICVETTAREAATREFRVLFLRGGGPAGDLQHDRVRLRRGSGRPRRHHANRVGGTPGDSRVSNARTRRPAGITAAVASTYAGGQCGPR